MSHETQDIGGRFLLIPYDWRMPTMERIKRRYWNPGGPMLSPKVWGWGWTLNLAHPGSRILLAAIALFVVAMVLMGGGQ